MSKLALQFGIPYNLFGVGLGALIFSFYLYQCWEKKNLADGVVIFLSSFGVIAGVDLCIISLYTDMSGCLEGDAANVHKIYIFIGGIAVVWASITAISRIIQGGKITQRRNGQPPASTTT